MVHYVPGKRVIASWNANLLIGFFCWDRVFRRKAPKINTYKKLPHIAAVPRPKHLWNEHL